MPSSPLLLVRLLYARALRRKRAGSTLPFVHIPAVAQAAAGAMASDTTNEALTNFVFLFFGGCACFSAFCEPAGPRLAIPAFPCHHPTNRPAPLIFFSHLSLQ